MFVFLPSYSLIVTVKSWESSRTKLFYLYKQNKTSILFFGDELMLISKPACFYWASAVCQLRSWQPPGALWFSHKERNVGLPFAMPSPFIYSTSKIWVLHQFAKDVMTKCRNWWLRLQKIYSPPQHKNPRFRHKRLQFLVLDVEMAPLPYMITQSSLHDFFTNTVLISSQTRCGIRSGLPWDQLFVFLLKTALLWGSKC